MSQPNSSASSSAQDLLDALLDVRKHAEQKGLDISDILRDSERFSSFMLDMRPGMKYEIAIISKLINEGLLMDLHSANANDRVRESGQIKVWLDNFGLKADDAQIYSDVLLAFCNGETQVRTRTESPQTEEPQKKQVRHDPQANSRSPQVPGTDQPILTAPAKPSSNTSGQQNDSINSAHGAPLPAPVATKSGAYRKYVLSFALLVLAAAIFFTKGPSIGISSSEPTAMPPAAPSVASSPEPTAMPTATPSVASSPEPTAMSAAANSIASSALSLHDAYANKRVGECFEFGRYPQGANGEIEPITWRVLQREADHLLVIAEKGLDCKRYNDKYCNVTWADCTLRHWLNSEFYDKAFNEQERNCILQTSIVNNVGPKTGDRISLLSVDEAECLFASENARRAEPTKYAAKNGVYTNEGYCWWWLRSRGNYDSHAANVCTNGGVNDDGNYVNDVDRAVRPAFKIAL